MPNVSTTELQRLKQIEQRYINLLDRSAMRPFVDEFTKVTMSFLAAIPFDKWPSSIQYCFTTAALKTPIGADLYRRNLPQD